ncbi:MAG: flavodoxin domain-containing protein [Candidatus Hodarchaeales archaeon]|jgi:menaquinone-dependent protoporphyrinogen IX oxidase
MSKTILAYVTRWGATTETAKFIAGVLKDEFNIDVDLVDIKDKKNKNLDIRPYDNVILGVSVAKFRWAKEGKKFLKNNRVILAGKKLFVFVSSGGAGEAYQRNDLEEYEKLQKKWIDNVLAKFSLQYTSRKALGGRFVGSFSNRGDVRDWDVIRNWAEEIGRTITSMTAST